MRLKVLKLNDNAVLPSYAHPDDAGLDLTVTSIEKINWFTTKYKFGLAIELPKGKYGDLRPRSSIFKQGLMWFSNSCGTIDKGYTGEIMIIVYNIPFLYKPYKVGERGAQLIISSYNMLEPHFVRKLTTSKRGDKGHGSSGK